MDKRKVVVLNNKKGILTRSVPVTNDSNNESSSGEEEEMLCPLCMEELDLTDRNFKPCQCGYQMCRFCWNEIMQNGNGKCPACRTTYDPEKYKFTPPDPKEVAKLKKKKSKKNKRKEGREVSSSLPGRDSKGGKKDEFSSSLGSRKDLTDLRVIQRNLVYITNLALSLAREDLLRTEEYFGSFGKILKVVINKNNLYNVNSPGGASVSAYITYVNKESARRCIESVDESWWGNRTVRASFGTTKYCSFFLKRIECTNPDCMYLHEMGGDDESFTKEEILLKRAGVAGVVGTNSRAGSRYRSEDDYDDDSDDQDGNDVDMQYDDGAHYRFRSIDRRGSSRRESFEDDDDSYNDRDDDDYDYNHSENSNSYSNSGNDSNNVSRDDSPALPNSGSWAVKVKGGQQPADNKRDNNTNKQDVRSEPNGKSVNNNNGYNNSSSNNNNNNNNNNNKRGVNTNGTVTSSSNPAKNTNINTSSNTNTNININTNNTNNTNNNNKTTGATNNNNSSNKTKLREENKNTRALSKSHDPQTQPNNTKNTKNNNNNNNNNNTEEAPKQNKNTTVNKTNKNEESSPNSNKNPPSSPIVIINNTHNKNNSNNTTPKTPNSIETNRLPDPEPARTEPDSPPSPIVEIRHTHSAHPTPSTPTQFVIDDDDQVDHDDDDADLNLDIINQSQQQPESLSSESLNADMDDKEELVDEDNVEIDNHKGVLNQVLNVDVLDSNVNNNNINIKPDIVSDPEDEVNDASGFDPWSALKLDELLGLEEAHTVPNIHTPSTASGFNIHRNNQSNRPNTQNNINNTVFNNTNPNHISSLQHQLISQQQQEYMNRMQGGMMHYPMVNTPTGFDMPWTAFGQNPNTASTIPAAQHNENSTNSAGGRDTSRWGFAAGVDDDGDFEGVNRYYNNINGGNGYNRNMNNGVIGGGRFIRGKHMYGEHEEGQIFEEESTEEDNEDLDEDSNDENHFMNLMKPISALSLQQQQQQQQQQRQQMHMYGGYNTGVIHRPVQPNRMHIAQQQQQQKQMVRAQQQQQQQQLQSSHHLMLEDMQQNFRRLLPNVNISFSNDWQASNNETTTTNSNSNQINNNNNNNNNTAIPNTKNNIANNNNNNNSNVWGNNNNNNNNSKTGQRGYHDVGMMGGMVYRGAPGMMTGYGVPGMMGVKSGVQGGYPGMMQGGQGMNNGGRGYTFQV